MFGMQINFKDGSKDWIDPCYEDPIEKDGVIYISNTGYTYEYELSNIEKWFKYDLCKYCDHDIRTYDCNDKECLKPKKRVFK